MGGKAVKENRIFNEEAFNQVLSFEGMDYDNGIHPTDMDGVIEYGDKAYVLYEVKHDGVDLRYAQRTYLERTVRDYAKAGKEALAIVADHQGKDPKEKVLLKDCMVREVLHSKTPDRWQNPVKPTTCLEMTDWFLSRFEDVRATRRRETR